MYKYQRLREMTNHALLLASARGRQALEEPDSCLGGCTSTKGTSLPRGGVSESWNEAEQRSEGTTNGKKHKGDMAIADATK